MRVISQERGETGRGQLSCATRRWELGRHKNSGLTFESMLFQWQPHTPESSQSPLKMCVLFLKGDTIDIRKIRLFQLPKSIWHPSLPRCDMGWDGCVHVRKVPKSPARLFIKQKILPRRFYHQCGRTCPGLSRPPRLCGTGWHLTMLNVISSLRNSEAVTDSGISCGLEGRWHGLKLLSKRSFWKNITGFELVNIIPDQETQSAGSPVEWGHRLEASSQAAAV